MSENAFTALRHLSIYLHFETGKNSKEKSSLFLNL